MCPVVERSPSHIDTRNPRGVIVALPASRKSKISGGRLSGLMEEEGGGIMGGMIGLMERRMGHRNSHSLDEIQLLHVSGPTLFDVDRSARAARGMGGADRDPADNSLRPTLGTPHDNKRRENGDNVCDQWLNVLFKVRSSIKPSEVKTRDHPIPNISLQAFDRGSIRVGIKRNPSSCILAPQRNQHSDRSVLEFGSGLAFDPDPGPVFDSAVRPPLCIH
ncbi:hypothetical protein EVAR_46017_1 [Eumeta japonica]|uniref:Uncharacterized protein n=1 Tax=Eumeta variegata TaxID=151549 RepID=A0A4C1Z6U9_EUMVA|nr:hypothetical protein EVAR_46017_1 [Eumeta japonica]